MKTQGLLAMFVCLCSTSDGRFASAGRLQEFPVLFGYLPNLRYLMKRC